jgi:hypothetical protein
MRRSLPCWCVLVSAPGSTRDWREGWYRSEKEAREAALRLNRASDAPGRPLYYAFWWNTDCALGDTSDGPSSP